MILPIHLFLLRVYKIKRCANVSISLYSLIRAENTFINITYCASPISSFLPIKCVHFALKLETASILILNLFIYFLVLLIFDSELKFSIQIQYIFNFTFRLFRSNSVPDDTQVFLLLLINLTINYNTASINFKKLVKL